MVQQFARGGGRVDAGLVGMHQLSGRHDPQYDRRQCNERKHVLLLRSIDEGVHGRTSLPEMVPEALKTLLAISFQ